MNKEQTWENFFYLGILAKGIEGLFEIFIGFFLLLVGKETLLAFFARAVGSEFTELPRDFFISIVYTFLQSILMDFKIFFALYVIAHGMINMGLALALWRERQWVFPVAIIIELFFVFYAAYYVIASYSFFWLVFVAFDTVLIVLIWHQYKRSRNINSRDQNFLPNNSL